MVITGIIVDQSAGITTVRTVPSPHVTAVEVIAAFHVPFERLRAFAYSDSDQLRRLAVLFGGGAQDRSRHSPIRP